MVRVLWGMPLMRGGVDQTYDFGSGVTSSADHASHYSSPQFQELCCAAIALQILCPVGGTHLFLGGGGRPVGELLAGLYGARNLVAHAQRLDPKHINKYPEGVQPRFMREVALLLLTRVLRKIFVDGHLGEIESNQRAWQRKWDERWQRPQV